MAEQDIGEIQGVDSLPSTDAETALELDAMLLAATEASGDSGGETPSAEDEAKAEADAKAIADANDAVAAAETEAAKKTAEAEEAAVTKAALENTDAGVDSNEKLRAEAAVEAEAAAEAATKAAAEVAAAEAVAKANEKKDELDTVEIPKNLRPKSAEAFETIKRLAREKVTASELRATELETRVKELETTAADSTDPLTPELKAELEELRTFRKKLDVESDPQFKSFDKTVEDNTESIYAKLSANGATAETIKAIKDMGGPDKIDWEPILDKLPPLVRRSIETKLVNSEEILENKARAIKEAKENADEFLSTRATHNEGQQKERQALAVSTLNGIRKEFTWMTPKVIDPKAKDQAAEKVAVDAHNELVKDSEQYLAEAMADDSPEMRATVAMAGPELFRARAELADLKATTTVQIRKLGNDLKQATTLLTKIKAGSTTRLRDTSAAAKAKLIPDDETAEQAIDRLAAEATQGA
jgi:hypothetical protein